MSIAEISFIILFVIFYIGSVVDLLLDYFNCPFDDEKLEV